MSARASRGYVTFRIGDRELAGRLEDVREVVRAEGLQPLPGCRAPVTAMLLLRGSPMPVVDLRTETGTDRPSPDGDAVRADGDVLVLAQHDGGPEGLLGLAVDRVVAVLDADALTPLERDARPAVVPSYVLESARDAAGNAVFVVDLATLAGLDPLRGAGQT